MWWVACVNYKINENNYDDDDDDDDDDDSGDKSLYLIHVFFGLPKSAPQTASWFSQFCMAHERDQQTDHTSPCYSVCIAS